MLVRIGACLTLLQFLLTSYAMAYTPSLWPPHAFDHLNKIVKEKAIALLKAPLKKAINEKSHAIATLKSAGKINANDPHLQRTRASFKDADNAALLALMYKLSHQSLYLSHAKTLLLDWAHINHPTGHPIDETRLEGFIWAYDLIADQLSLPENKEIIKWFNVIKHKKNEWIFGSLTTNNNHRIHHLKMCLLIDKALNNEQEIAHDLAEIKKYLSINLGKKEGASRDYLERHALFYHNYVLQAWLTMSLISGSHFQEVENAFYFLLMKIRNNEIGEEFVHSHAVIDEKRARNGFKYARRGGAFDVNRALSTFILFYTPRCQNMPNDVEYLINSAHLSHSLAFSKARLLLWQNAIC